LKVLSVTYLFHLCSVLDTTDIYFIVALFLKSLKSKHLSLKIDKIMKKVRTNSCGKHYSTTSCKNKQKNGVKKTVLDSLTNKTFVNTYIKLVDLTTQFATKLEVSSSSLSKQKIAKYDRTIADETEEQAASSSSNTVQNNIVSIQFPSTSKISSSHKTKSPKHDNAANVSMKKKGNKNVQISNDDKWTTESLATNLVSVEYI